MSAPAAAAEADEGREFYGRTMPHDLDAERCVLGGMMMSKDAIGDVLDVLRGRDFYRPAHRLIFEAVLDLYGRFEPVDVVTVKDELAKRGDLARVGGAPYLHTCLSAVPTASNAAYYARIVREKAILCRLIEMGTRIAARGYEEQGDASDLAYLARAELDAILNNDVLGDDLERMAALMDRTLGELSERLVEMPGLKTGFADLDALLAGGVHPGQLILIAARPATGKTNLAMDLARAFAVRRGHPTLFFSLEMSRDEIIRGLIAAEAGVLFQKVRTCDLGEADWARIYRVCPRLSDAPLFIDDSAGTGLDHMLRRYEELARDPATRPQVIIVDYIQLMATPKTGRRGDNRQQEVSDLSRGLKLLGKRLGIPVIALAQLNRGPEQRADKRPLLSDLRESGSLEQDADVVILLHREDMYERESPRAGEADFIVAKQRNGPTSTVTTAFQGHYRRFVDMAPVSHFDQPTQAAQAAQGAGHQAPAYIQNG